MQSGKRIKTIGHIVFFVLGTAASGIPQAAAAEVSPRVDLRNVEVGGEIGRRIDITVNNNCLVLDADGDFLKPFQERKRTGGYIGLGKLIDSLVRLAAHTGNERLLALKKHVVDETIAAQEDDGYIGLMAPDKRMWALWDIHEMAYLVNGLTTDYTYFGEKRSLEAARQLMDYVIRRWSAEPDRFRPNITVFMAVTGLEEALLMLYQATGDKRYLDFCVDFRKLPQWDYPIVLGRWGPIGGHAYAYMHRCLAQLRLHQIQPNPRLLEQAHGVIDFLTRRDGLLINGVCSQHECWHDTQDGTEGLGETCATAYLLRLLDELIRMERDSLHGDIMERAIYNGLFAAQSPDGRRLRYYVPFEGPRVYFRGDTYCCPCNYRRIVAELPMMVYYRFGRGLAVNLYAPSEAKTELEDGVSLTVRQETEYPNAGEAEIVVEPSEPAAFPVFLRIPRWCKNARVGVNGEWAASAVPGGQFFSIERTWKAGDRIKLNMPMDLRLVRGRKAQAGRVAVMRGPQVFCLSRKRNPAVADLDLRQIVIDPDTLEGPQSDDTVRPGGMAVRVKGWKRLGFTTGGGHNLDLVLTEFADPDGEATYFHIRRLGRVGVEDELVQNE